LFFIDGEERTDQRFQILGRTLSVDPGKQKLKAKVMVNPHGEAQPPQMSRESFKQKRRIVWGWLHHRTSRD
jgi:hypothetical protein